VVDHRVPWRRLPYRVLKKIGRGLRDHYGGGGAPTTLVSGRFRMSAFGPLRSVGRFFLPRYLHLRLDQIAVTPSSPYWIFWRQKPLGASYLIALDQLSFMSLFVYRPSRSYAGLPGSTERVWFGSHVLQASQQAIVAMPSGLQGLVCLHH